MPRITSKNADFPRAYPDHRTTKGREYTRYCRALLATLGALPDSAMPTLREAGRLAVDLNAAGYELDAARRANRRKDVARLRRQLTSMRGQFLTLERRLEELAGDRQQTPMATLANLPELDG